MIVLVYHKGGGKALLQFQSASDTALNAQIYLEREAAMRILDGCVLEGASTVHDPRIPDTVAEFDLMFPDQPAIVK